MNEAVEAEAAGLAEDRKQTIATAVPEAQEALDPTMLAVLHDTMNATGQALTDGQVEPIPSPQMEGEVRAVPAETFAGIAALEGFASQVEEGKPYRGMTQNLVTNDGIGEVTDVLEGMGSDAALKRAAMNAATPDAEAPEAEAPAPDAEAPKGRKLDQLKR